MTNTDLPPRVHFGRGVLDLGGVPRVMAILNVTPDSFYPASRVEEVGAVVERALMYLEEGADLLDIGGESTRPGAAQVPVETELSRVIPVVAALRRVTDKPISVDTSRVEVARLALEAGADFINDVTALAADGMAALLSRYTCGVILMHTRGTSATMAGLTRYGSLVAEVRSELSSRLQLALQAGIDPHRLILDPGIGFAKAGEQNLTLLRYLSEFHTLGRPLLVGASRKSFLEKCFGHTLENRLEGSLAAAIAAAQGGVSILRVHDVAATRRLLDVWWGIHMAPRGDTQPEVSAWTS